MRRHYADAEDYYSPTELQEEAFRFLNDHVARYGSAGKTAGVPLSCTLRRTPSAIPATTTLIRAVSTPTARTSRTRSAGMGAPPRRPSTSPSAS